MSPGDGAIGGFREEASSEQAFGQSVAKHAVSGTADSVLGAGDSLGRSTARPPPPRSK